MKRDFDSFKENAYSGRNQGSDVDVIQLGPETKKRKLIRVINGRNVVFSEKKLRIYINKARNDLQYIKSRLFGNMEFVVGGIHIEHPYMLTKKFLLMNNIDYVCQISRNINDVHRENVYIQPTGKLIVLIPKKPIVPQDFEIALRSMDLGHNKGNNNFNNFHPRNMNMNHGNHGIRGGGFSPPRMAGPPPRTSNQSNEQYVPPPPMFGLPHHQQQSTNQNMNSFPPPQMHNNFGGNGNRFNQPHQNSNGMTRRRKKKKPSSSSEMMNISEDLEDDFGW